MKEGTERKEKSQPESGRGLLEPGRQVRAVEGTGQPLAGKSGKPYPRTWSPAQMTMLSATDLSRFLKTRLFKVPEPKHWGPGERPTHTPSARCPASHSSFPTRVRCKGCWIQTLSSLWNLSSSHPPIREYFTFCGRSSRGKQGE